MDSFEYLRDAVIDDIKANLKPKRFHHVLVVAEAAKQLAPLYGVDAKEAEIAALLHDNAKFMAAEELLRVCGADCAKYRLSEEHAPVLHAFAGAVRAEEMYPLLKADILNAVRFHTTGRAAMSKLEMLIFIADYIELGREPFEGLSEARKAASEGPEACMLQILDQTYKYLTEEARPIHPLNREAHEYYKALCSVKGQ